LVIIGPYQKKNQVGLNLMIQKLVFSPIQVWNHNVSVETSKVINGVEWEQVQMHMYCYMKKM